MHLLPVIEDHDHSLDKLFDLTMLRGFNESRFPVEAPGSIEHAPLMSHLGNRARHEIVIQVLKVDPSSL